MKQLTDKEKQQFVQGAVLATSELTSAPFWEDVQKEYDKLTKRTDSMVKARQLKELR